MIKGGVSLFCVNPSLAPSLSHIHKRRHYKLADLTHYQQPLSLGTGLTVQAVEGPDDIHSEKG